VPAIKELAVHVVRLSIVATMALATCGLAVTPSASRAADDLGSVTSSGGTGAIYYNGITVGPDGALWFTNFAHNSIGRITTSGTISTYAGIGVDNPAGITTGPDGALWFTNAGNGADRGTDHGSIGRITTTGEVTNYTYSGPGAGIAQPTSITAGPDRALWFTNTGNGSIGRITTSGKITIYAPASLYASSTPYSITVGPDGALWFTNAWSKSIGRITTSGKVTLFNSNGISSPEGITAGPDGALWFTNDYHKSIGRITTSGKVSIYTSADIDDPDGITVGSDGALWWANFVGNSIGRITMGGKITIYPDSGIGGPLSIVSGPDGALWFTNVGYLPTNDLGVIGRISASGELTIYTGTGTTATEAAAIAWAEKLIGSQLGAPGQEYWYGCLAFALNAYQIGAGVPIRSWIKTQIGASTYPSDVWGHFTHGTTGAGNDPPVGALVFWDSTGGGNATIARDDSHVAISLGGGLLVSTNVDQSNISGYNGIHKETMTQFAENSWNIYKGWWLPDAP
jgi:virginiamycin B lyase